MAGFRELAQRFLPGHGDPEGQHSAAEADRDEASVTRTELNVTGMTCGHCKAAVEGELARLPGVDAEADVETGVVRVSYDAAQAGPEQLEAAVREAGYSVAPREG